MDRNRETLPELLPEDFLDAEIDLIAHGTVAEFNELRERDPELAKQILLAARKEGSRGDSLGQHMKIVIAISHAMRRSTLSDGGEDQRL